MATVALDADVLIGFLDAGDLQHDRAVRALRAWLSGEHRVLIGATVYAEILVRPLWLGTADRVEEFLGAISAVVVPVDRALARRAAALRSRHRSLRLPDALVLATAMTTGAELLTLDRRLARIAREETPGRT